MSKVLNQARTILEKYKYAFEWNAELHRAAEKVEGSEKVDFWDAVHKPSPLSAFVGVTCALGGLQLAQHLLRAWDVTLFGVLTTVR